MYVCINICVCVLYNIVIQSSVALQAVHINIK